MRTYNSILVALMFISFSACGQNANLEEVEFLVGTWKIEGKQNYESWAKEDNRLTGQSYKIENGQKVVSETIELKKVENQIVYTAKVFDQNEGKSIPFILKSSKNDLFSFENPTHDFPKKIQYQILNEHKLYVSVLGEDDKGFSYHLIKQTD